MMAFINILLVNLPLLIIYYSVLKVSPEAGQQKSVNKDQFKVDVHSSE